MVKVRTTAKSCARRDCGKQCGMGLVCPSPAETAKHRILAINHIVCADIEIVPVFDYLRGVRVVIEQTSASTILCVGTVGLGENI